MKKLLTYFLIVAACVAILSGCKKQDAAKPANPEIILATTTSTRDSGLLDVLIPVFEKQTGYVVKTIAVGTGQAIELGIRGDADVLLTHAPDAEIRAMETGALINRQLLMHNDFIIIGMNDDRANIKGRSAADALRAIANTQSVFVSRGDNSGTHMLERKLWQEAGITPAGSWYLESGAGMGQTLGIANERNGYTIADRGTYLAHMRNLDLVILVEGDEALLNIYHVMEVNPERFSRVNNAGARAFADFLLTSEGQKMIAEFGKDTFGQPLFFLGDGKK